MLSPFLCTLHHLRFIEPALRNGGIPLFLNDDAAAMALMTMWRWPYGRLDRIQSEMTAVELPHPPRDLPATDHPSRKYSAKATPVPPERSTPSSRLIDLNLPLRVIPRHGAVGPSAGRRHIHGRPHVLADVPQASSRRPSAHITGARAGHAFRAFQGGPSPWRRRQARLACPSLQMI